MNSETKPTPTVECPSGWFKFSLWSSNANRKTRLPLPTLTWLRHGHLSIHGPAGAAENVSNLPWQCTREKSFKLDYLNTSSTELIGHTINPNYSLSDSKYDIYCGATRNAVNKQAENSNFWTTIFSWLIASYSKSVDSWIYHWTIAPYIKQVEPWDAEQSKSTAMQNAHIMIHTHTLLQVL